ncbi:MAG: hypothetical protein RLZZ15_2790, partial [Verrucomicrobiota bacterium]
MWRLTSLVRLCADSLPFRLHHASLSSCRPGSRQTPYRQLRMLGF